MKTVLKILIIPIALILAYLIFNQYIINTYDGRLCVSPSIEMSKKNNLYLGVYKPLKDSVSLKDKKIKAVDIWTEKRWRDGHTVLFFREIYTEDGFNLIVPYKTKFDSVDYVVEPPDRNYISKMGGRPGLGFVYSYSGRLDTIKLYIQQRKYDSWAESMNVDSINYIKAY